MRFFPDFTGKTFVKLQNLALERRPLANVPRCTNERTKAHTHLAANLKSKRDKSESPVLLTSGHNKLPPNQD